MSSTLLELVNAVLRRTGQVEITTLLDAQPPATQVRDFLNETCNELRQHIAGYRLEATETLITTPGVNQYELLPSGRIASLNARSLSVRETGQRLQEVDALEVSPSDLQATGAPRHFYRQGEHLTVLPTPDAVYHIQYLHQNSPATLVNDTDVPGLPDDWKDTLIVGAQSRLEHFLGESGEETYLLYRDALSQLKRQNDTRVARRMKGFYRGYR